jgi:CHASE3 domain sensor protein
MSAPTAPSPWTSAKSRLLPKVKASLALPVIILLVIGLLSFRTVGRFSRDATAVARSHEILTHFADAVAALREIEAGTRGFALTGDNACLQSYFAAQETLRDELDSVSRMTAANPRRQQGLAACKPLIDNLLVITWATIAERKTGAVEAALVRLQTGGADAAVHRLRIAIQQMQDEERSLLEQRRGAAQRSGRMTQWIIVLAILCAVLLVTLASMTIHRDIVARHRAEQEREVVVEELRQALATVKTLSGLLPICAWCKDIRDDQGYWKQLEEYIHDHTEANFTHGICPDCLEKQEKELTTIGLSLAGRL